ncbi:glutamyl-tRNA reductase [Variovorax sp. PCZ-1]|uniref:glutamyl-tRNA reductase n=1 Tax=Variovorax sp. PCZ-1 TaxID=2835533 RepID=UPI001BCE2C6F|nr:glutamyl-tRNA reductase [Variovorax sp. PCZ-1]MBS7806923.1 glutamyl-tRNA reductase [Variovorax sp. PCZ-1]
MTVWALGINHTTAPLDLRGRFAFALDQITPALSSLRSSLHAEPELTLVSTCNRTEIYGSGDSAQTAQVLQWLASSGGVSSQSLQSHTYTLEGSSAARHAFRVAAGLDSMVLGETQILGQLKDAVNAAEHAGALGSTLHQMFQRSFAVAKEVRSSTDIGTQSISMAAAAVRLSSQLFEDLSKIRILFVGAGEMIELAATHFAAKNPRQIVIANRTMERGQALIDRLAPAAATSNTALHTMHLGELPSRLHEFDAVISCTASTLPIIGLGAVERAIKARKRRPIFMVDLAVPRDIEPEVKALDDVYLYTVDDLAGVVQTAQATRQAAVAQAEVIVDAGVQDFLRWMQQRSEGTTNLIQQLNAQSDAWRAAEISRAKKLLAKGEDIDAVLEALSKGVAQKFLHPAYLGLGASEPSQRAAAQEAVQRLYLKPQEPGER